MITVGMAVAAHDLAQMQKNLCDEYWHNLVTGGRPSVRATILMALDHLDKQMASLQSFA